MDPVHKFLIQYYNKNKSVRIPSTAESIMPISQEDWVGTTVDTPFVMFRNVCNLITYY